MEDNITIQVDKSKIVDGLKISNTLPLYTFILFDNPTVNIYFTYLRKLSISYGKNGNIGGFLCPLNIELLVLYFKDLPFEKFNINKFKYELDRIIRTSENTHAKEWTTIRNFLALRGTDQHDPLEIKKLEDQMKSTDFIDLFHWSGMKLMKHEILDHTITYCTILSDKIPHSSETYALELEDILQDPPLLDWFTKWLALKHQLTKKNNTVYHTREWKKEIKQIENNLHLCIVIRITPAGRVVKFNLKLFEEKIKRKF